MKMFFYLLVSILIIGCHQNKNTEPDVDYLRVYRELTANGYYKKFINYDIDLARSPHCYLVTSFHPSFKITVNFIEPERIKILRNETTLNDALRKSSPGRVDEEAKRIIKEIAVLINFMEKESIQSVYSARVDTVDYLLDFYFLERQSLRRYKRGGKLPGEKIDSFWTFVKRPTD